MTMQASTPVGARGRTLQARSRGILALLAVAALALLPWWASDLYILHLATLICIYWVLVAGLNLVVGYSGQLSIGHVGLLALGAYTYAILAGRYGVPPPFAMLAGAGSGLLVGFLLGLPSLRLPGFYFAMATIAFSLIVSEITLAQSGLTGGGAGIAVPPFPAPFETPGGLFLLALAFAVGVTWLTWNISRGAWGRALIALRDTEVAAQSVGIPTVRAKITVFSFSGATAGLAGALFAILQSYITPDTFAFDLGLFFFVSIVIGGRGSIVGPLAGTVVLTALPELAAPLAKLGNFFYGLLLLVVVLLLPEGIGQLFAFIGRSRRSTATGQNAVEPELERLAAALRRGPGSR